jgi:hypothetical protein
MAGHLILRLWQSAVEQRLAHKEFPFPAMKFHADVKELKVEIKNSITRLCGRTLNRVKL